MIDGPCRLRRVGPKKAKNVKYLALAARLLIGGLLIMLACTMFWTRQQFAVSIRNYMYFRFPGANVMAVTLPWIELGAGALLILGIYTRPAALLTTGMLVVFLAAIIYAYTIGLDIDCGCFSSAASSQGKITFFEIVRDSTLVLISLFIVLADRGDYLILRLFRFSHVTADIAD